MAKPSEQSEPIIGQTKLIGIEGGLAEGASFGSSGGGGGFSSGGSDGGGGGFVSKELLDSRIETVKAQNDTAFTRLEGKIDAIQPGATWQQNAGILITGIIVTLGLVFAVLSWGSDRFDSGVSAMGAIEEALDSQRDLNASQEARMDLILEALGARDAAPAED